MLGLVGSGTETTLKLAQARPNYNYLASAVGLVTDCNMAMGSTQYEDDSKDRVGILSHAVDKEKLKPGDHIYFYTGVHRSSNSVHGIFTGELGKEVIYFSGTPKSKSSAHVRATTLDEFLSESGDGQLRLEAYGENSLLAKVLKRRCSTHGDESRPPDEVVSTAKECLQNPQMWDDYNRPYNNCKTFAIYCKTGYTS